MSTTITLEEQQREYLIKLMEEPSTVHWLYYTACLESIDRNYNDSMWLKNYNYLAKEEVMAIIKEHMLRAHITEGKKL